MSFTHFDQSTWLAHRAIDAEAIGPPEPPKLVALPGAKAAIPHDRLLAHHARGNSEHVIVQRTNDRWRRENADRLQAHQRWIAGPYQSAIEELRKQAMEEAAEELRRRAVFERLLADQEG